MPIRTIIPGLAAALSVILLGYSTPAAAQQSLGFTQAQVDAGKALYQETCQICHGSSLANGQFGTPLRGNYFRNNWKGKSAGELMQFIYEKMPPDNLMSLAPAQYTAAVAYILSRNDIAAGEQMLGDDYHAARELALPWE